MRAEPIAHRRLITVARIHEHRATRDAGGERLLDLRPGDLSLGGKAHLLGHPGNLAALLVPGPLLRQIQPVAKGETANLGGQCKTHRHLAILRLAQMPAILTGHAHRVLAPLAIARVVDDPEARRLPLTAQYRHHLACHRREQRHIAPLGVSDQVMHRLMRRFNVLRIYPRGHRLHALALPRQHQPAQIPARRRGSIRMTQRLNHLLGIPFES